MRPIIELSDQLAILKEQYDTNEKMTKKHFDEILHLSKYIIAVEINKPAVELYVDEICQINHKIKTRRHENYRLSDEISTLEEQIAD